MRRLAPVTIGSNGRPRVLIPDSVFQKGAELHKDFIICYFNGRAPLFNQIQSVFNHLWGKGKRLEIHNNLLNNSAIVRIQSEYLRQKILDKNVWYVGDTMFHTALWSSDHSRTATPLKAIKIWAHLTGVPLDLRHEEGLSLVAGLVGEPKETDDFTKNLVSLTLSHVKVEVDLTQPLPSVVEFERQSGEVVEVLVSYPWVPPTCTHCHELGHIMRNCLLYTPPRRETDGAKKKPAASKETSKQSKKYRPVSKTAHVPPVQSTTTAVAVSDPPLPTTTGSDHPPTPPIAPLAISDDLIPPIQNPPSLLQYPVSVVSSFKPSSFNPFLTPEPIPRPSLKRSRSSPTLSPPLIPHSNPFSSTLSLSDPVHPHPPNPDVPNLSFPSNSPLLLNSFSVLGGSSILSEDPQNLA